MTYWEIKRLVASGKLRQHSTAWTRGYLSRKSNPIVEPYQGRYGKGYCVFTPSWKSTQYHYVTYYLEVN